MLRVIANLLLAGAIAYALILVLVFFLQPRLVYFPQTGSELAATPLAAGLAFDEVWLQTADGETLHAWWTPVPRPRGAVLILHGNAGNISHRLEYLAMFHKLGYATLILDYRGYGRSSGVPSEEGTYRDADAGWRYLLETRKLTAQQIIIFGESLGGGVASWLAAKYPPRALLLASTFTSVPDLGARVYPWLPVRMLARIEYGNLQRIGQIAAPVLIAHSRGDEIIPFAHGEALFSAAREPKRFLALSGGHNEGFLYGRDEWVAAVGAFLDSTAPR
jgi:alpha-beta hydrolase superfamily lysophospholipase